MRDVTCAHIYTKCLTFLFKVNSQFPTLVFLTLYFCIFDLTLVFVSFLFCLVGLFIRFDKGSYGGYQVVFHRKKSFTTFCFVATKLHLIQNKNFNSRFTGINNGKSLLVIT